VGENYGLWIMWFELHLSCELRVLCFELKSWLVCVVVLRIWVLRVLISPTLHCAFFVISIVGRETPNYGYSSHTGKDSKGKDRGIQVDHRITWKGLSANLVHWVATTWMQTSVTWSNHWIKIACLLCCFLCDWLCSQELTSKLLSRTNSLIN
jgi:hypothetical protein